MAYWKKLIAIPADRLIDARKQLHWAAQIAASIGYTYVEAEENWSHLSLTSHFDEDTYLLLSEPALHQGGFRVGLRLADLTLVLLDDRLVVKDIFPLHGKTMEDGYGWMQGAIRPYLKAAARRDITRPDHELPFHRVSEGATFDAQDTDAFQVLSDWYANAEHILRSVVQEHAEASPVRCWPHHFDIASLLVYDPDKDPEEARSVGVGFVPGDSGYQEPYWYVTPWPYPESPDLPQLDDGHWHREGWFGAVLTSTELINAGGDRAQDAILTAFLNSAISANKRFLIEEE